MTDRLPKSLFGLDSTSEVPTAAHRAAGSTFAMRYLSRFTAKVPTRTEVANYRAAGIGLGAVFEDNAENALRGYATGRADAEYAVSQAESLGMPANRPIFFAVDFDTAGRPQATDTYFDGVASVLGHQRCGPYGGFEVVRHQMDRGFQWAWQTYAWSGSALDARAQIYQFSNNRVVGGIGVDFNHAFYGDYGQWHDPPPPPDPDPHHYLWFSEGPFRVQNREIFERWLVTEYDRYRVAPHVGANAEMLNLLREDITTARKRVWQVAHVDDQTGKPTNPPTWNEYHRGWRWQQLMARSQGARVV